MARGISRAAAGVQGIRVIVWALHVGHVSCWLRCKTKKGWELSSWRDRGCPGGQSGRDISFLKCAGGRGKVEMGGLARRYIAISPVGERRRCMACTWRCRSGPGSELEQPSLSPGVASARSESAVEEITEALSQLGRAVVCERVRKDQTQPATSNTRVGSSGRTFHREAGA